METAIKRAIEGGWKTSWVVNGNFLKDECYGTILDHLNHADSNFLLNPTFWQALGKAEGWGNNGVSHAIFKYIASIDRPTKRNPSPTVEKDMYRYEVPAWSYHWHRFIDHLAQGKDVESFFKDLLK